MSTFIRLDEDHFAYLTSHALTPEHAKHIADRFMEFWPDKRLLVLEGDEFIDLTGRFKVVPLPEVVEGP